MTKFWYNTAKEKLLRGTLDLDGGLAIQVALVMTGSSCPTQEDVDDLDAFSALNDYDGTPYARQAITESVTRDDTNDWAYFTDSGGTTTWSALGSTGTGTGPNLIGALVYDHVGADTANTPIIYNDTGGFPFPDTGADVSIQWNALGIGRVKNPTP